MMAGKLSREKYLSFPGIPSQTTWDKINWETLPYAREKAVFLPLPLFNVEVVLSRTSTFMMTYKIDSGDRGRGKVTLPN